MDGALGRFAGAMGVVCIAGCALRLLHRRLTPTLLRSRATQPRGTGAQRDHGHTAIRRFKVSAYR